MTDPILSHQLVQDAPTKMPEIVRSMHHTAAKALEDAARELETEMQSHIGLMREEAEQLRIQGDGQAATIEALSTLIRDTHTTFKEQADKIAKFRNGDNHDPALAHVADSRDLRTDPGVGVSPGTDTVIPIKKDGGQRRSGDELRRDLEDDNFGRAV